MRGWDFSASVEITDGARWALFAEKAVVMLRESQQAAATPIDASMGTEYLRAAIPRQQAGAADVARLRPMLFPED